jgi:predicted GTPase
MSFGAGIIAAERYEAVIVDPRPYAVGSISDTLKRYPSINRLIPALGYASEQLKDLEDTVNSTPCDAVLIATPVNLARVLKIEKPAIRVEYEVVETEPARLSCMIDRFLSSKK